MGVQPGPKIGNTVQRFFLDDLLNLTKTRNMSSYTEVNMLHHWWQTFYKHNPAKKNHRSVYITNIPTNCPSPLISLSSLFRYSGFYHYWVQTSFLVQWKWLLTGTASYLQTQSWLQCQDCRTTWVICYPNELQTVHQLAEVGLLKRLHDWNSEERCKYYEMSLVKYSRKINQQFSSNYHFRGCLHFYVCSKEFDSVSR